MYEAHWGLCESPFRGPLDRKFFYPSPIHEEALARLHFLVDNRRRLGVLVGGSGTGKSLLLQVFADQLAAQGEQAALINLLGLNAGELLWRLAAQLKINPADHDPPQVLWRKVVDRLAENRYQQLSTVVLLDDADEAVGEILLYVLRLLHADPSPQTRLTLVLSLNPSNIGRLGPRLLDLLELRIELEPWDESETCRFLQDSMAKAGCQSPVFAPPAASRLHQLSRGVPRQVSQLAELALLAGAGRHLGEIDQHTVEAAFQELGCEW